MSLLYQSPGLQKAQDAHQHREQIDSVPAQFLTGQQDHQTAEQNGADHRQLGNIGVQGKTVPRLPGDSVAGILSKQHGILPQQYQRAGKQRRTEQQDSFEGNLSDQIRQQEEPHDGRKGHQEAGFDAGADHIHQCEGTPLLPGKPFPVFFF